MKKKDKRKKEEGKGAIQSKKERNTKKKPEIQCFYPKP